MMATTDKMMQMMSGGPHGGHHMGMTTHGVNHHMGMASHGGNHNMGMPANGHTGHDDPSGGHGGGHNMFFSIGEKVTLLFEGLSVIEDDTGSFIAACIIIFAIAASYEGLKGFRERLIRRYSNHHGYEATDLEKRGSQTPLSGIDDIHEPTCCNGWHLLQSFLHIVQVTVSYLLMLLVMTFNVWIGLSVVLGAGFGYFLFAWKRTTTVDVNEHCH